MNLKVNQYRPPIVFHPGETLEEKLEELGMGPKEFALRTNKPEKTIIQVIKGKSSITPDMAVQFENVLKIPAHFWLNMQQHYDEFNARIAYDGKVSESIAWAKKFPIGDLVKCGWLPKAADIHETTSALLSFFGLSTHEAWEDYYLNQELKVAFRISLKHTKEPYAISAWLRRGELQASELPDVDYNAKAFKEALPVIRDLVQKHPDDFFQQLQAICLAAGVKVVHTPCINKAPISGCTRWMNDTPLIQLTGRYKRNDIFWFTFFHEAGHILLHGKKDIFLENIDYSEKDMQKEEEADEFAVKWTLSREEESTIVEKGGLNDDDILMFAHQFKTHPAIIMGRLRKLGIARYSQGSHFFVPIELG